MLPKFGLFSRYRPRVLTVVLLFTIAALVVMANACCDEQPDFLGTMSEFWGTIWTGGWPFTWYAFAVAAFKGGVSWQCNVPRLLGNAAIWLILSAALAAACEWLLRRYRPRLRFTLRTMLAAVAMAAGVCGWFAAARNRASLQDPLIAAIEGRWSYEPWGPNGQNSVPARVWVERRGPEWFELAGIERYRRQIVAIDTGRNYSYPDAADPGIEDMLRVEEILRRSARLPRVQYLYCDAEQLTPAMIDSICRMRDLRSLSITVDNVTAELADLPADLPDLRILSVRQRFGDEPLPPKCLAAIGRITTLECLHLNRPSISPQSLSTLAKLQNLKSLFIECAHSDSGEDEPDWLLLAYLPALPRLEALSLEESQVGRLDLRRLAVLPRLKSLNLFGTWLKGEDLAELGALDSLEELAIDFHAVSADGLEALLAVKNLRRLHLGYSGCDRPKVEVQLDRDHTVQVSQAEHGRFCRALESLRRTKPGIVIDGDYELLEWQAQRMIPSRFTSIPGPRPKSALELFREWRASK